MTYNEAILELVKIQDTMMVDRDDNKRMDVKIKPLYTQENPTYATIQKTSPLYHPRFILFSISPDPRWNRTGSIIGIRYRNWAPAT